MAASRQYFVHALATLVIVLSAQEVSAQLTYPECANMQASDFAVDTLVRNAGDTEMREPLKMAFDMDAQGNVDVYFVQRHGKVRRYAGASRTTVTLADFAFTTGTSATDTAQICAGCSSNGGTFNSSEGLMAIALDPGFKTNGWVYLYFTVKSVWRVTRYKLTGNTLDVNSGKTILRYTHPSFSQHMGGALRFDTDGVLWVSVSDNASTGNTTSPYAPDLRYLSANSNSPFGKIMRIKPKPLADAAAAPAPGLGATYDIPTGNLRQRFHELGGSAVAGQDTTKILPEIYVMGTRNAYTISLDTVRKAVTWGDVGPDQFGSATDTNQFSEEFNITTSPGFFGYPYWVGRTNGGITLTNAPVPTGSTPAVPISNHSSNTGVGILTPARVATIGYGKACAVGGSVYYYNGSQSSTVKFPPHFHGVWFVADFNNDWIDAVRLNAAGTQVLSQTRVFARTGTGNLVNTTFMTDNSGTLLEHQIGPDGALYIVNYNGYRTTTANTGLYRVRYQGTCRPNSVNVAFRREHEARPAVARLEGTMLQVLPAGAHRVELRDPAGRLVWSRSGHDAAAYDLKDANLEGGLRLLSVTVSGERFVRKLML